MWASNGGKSVGLLPGRETLGPLFLMTTTPVFIFVLWHTLMNLDGSMARFAEEVGKVCALLRQHTTSPSPCA
jgi:hypothetical protein